MTWEPLYHSKYRERDVDLAVKGWGPEGNLNLDNPDSVRIFQMIGSGGQIRPDESCEIHLEKPAYCEILREDMVDVGAFAVYARIYGTKIGLGGHIPSDLVGEAKHFLRLRKKGKHLVERFLLDVYSQVVKGRNGIYKNKVDREEQGVVAILNYFSDKLRSFGRSVEASKLEIETKKRVHVKTPEEYFEEQRNWRGEIEKRIEKEYIEDSLGKNFLDMTNEEAEAYMQRRRERALGKLSNL